MDLYQYQGLYSLLWFVIDLFAVMAAILGCVMAVHGYGRISRFVGFVLLIGCLAVLSAGVVLAFELPFKEVERFSDEYIKHVDDPEEPKEFILLENIFVAFFAVSALLSNLALLVGASHARLKRRRKKAALASA